MATMRPGLCNSCPCPRKSKPTSAKTGAIDADMCKAVATLGLGQGVLATPSKPAMRRSRRRDGALDTSGLPQAMDIIRPAQLVRLVPTADTQSYGSAWLA